MRNLFRNLMAIISTFSPTLTSKLYYFIKFHKKLNLRKPETFNEKLMWIKLKEYKNNELVSACADKYKVREYIENNGCEEILNEILYVYDDVKEINFDKLPDKFVLKCNHAAGYNIICEDKTKLDEKKVKRQLRKWLKTDYWKFVAEVQYKNIKPKIICEKYLDSKSESSIEDYKIYCFHGEPKFCMVCVGRNLGKPKYYFVDKNWKVMKINKTGLSVPENFKIDKPKCINKMYEYAKKLSKPFKFVRVDFYEYKGKVIFGELTFTPAGCIDKNYTEGADIELGKLINIGEKNENGRIFKE